MISSNDAPAPPGDIAVAHRRRRTPRKRPSIGLALGGGAARGFAHIGVLRTLQKHGIEAQVIAGTSIGAVVGGFMRPDGSTHSRSGRAALTRRRIFGYLDFSIAGSGLIGGTTACRQPHAAKSPTSASRICRQARGDRDRDRHRPRNLADARPAHRSAVRVLCAARHYFRRCTIGGRWLMDGALVNPVPVSAARAAGARLVIAVNLNGLFSRGTIIQNHGVDDAETVAETR